MTTPRAGAAALWWVAGLALLAACGNAATPHGSALPSPREPETIRMEGESMIPTLDNGDLLIADRGAYAAAPPRRGDIVLLQPPQNPNRLFVKRVIGLPNDVVEIGGRYVDPRHPDAAPRSAVLVKPGGRGDWMVLKEPYLPDQANDPWDEMDNCCDATGRATSVPTPLTIPSGEYFILGDNRNRSSDSRSIGLIPAGNILARCLYRTHAGTTSWLYSTNTQLQ